MRNKNNIIRFSCVAVLSLFMVSLNACYVDLKEKDITWHAGHIEFYKEYRAQVEETIEEKLISFPVRCCDPLQIMSCRNVRWFFTSAIGSHPSHLGQAYEITDPSITDVFVVRGKRAGHWVQIYCGYDANNPKFASCNGNKNVYEGKVLYIYLKNTQNTEYSHGYAISGVKHLAARIWQQLNGNIWLDVRDDTSSGAPLRVNINNQDLFSDLIMSERRELYDRMRLTGGQIMEQSEHVGYSNTCYWTKEENKLKGIRYKSSK